MAEGTETAPEGNQRKGLISSSPCIILLAFGAYYETGVLLTSLEIYRNQLDGLCLDGRNSSESMGAVGFQVVSGQLDSMTEYGPATQTPELMCAFPVTVRSCNATECKDLPQLKTHQRVRQEATGVRCWATLSIFMYGVSPCKDDVWDCTFGSCNGYQKSGRLCDGKLRLETYSCIFDPNNPSVSIKEERSGLSDCVYAGTIAFVCAATLAYICWSVGLISKLATLKDCRQLTGLQRLGIKLLVFVVALVLFQRAVFVYILPGETYYSLWGAPKLAAPTFVQFTGKASEKPVPVGYNELPPMAAAFIWIAWIMQLYVGLFLSAVVPVYIAYKWFKSMSPQDSYQRMESASSDSDSGLGEPSIRSQRESSMTESALESSPAQSRRESATDGQEVAPVVEGGREAGPIRSLADFL